MFQSIRLEVERCAASVARSRSMERVKVEKAERGKTVLPPTDLMCRISMLWASKA